MEPTDNEPRTTGKAIIDTLDAVIDDAGDLMGGTRTSKIAGGAAIGAVAAVVLPFSLLTGALIGAGYSAWRQSNRPRL
ncbi:MAG: hypothetical protein ABI898_10075 [Sphingomonadales bacterium]